MSTPHASDNVKYAGQTDVTIAETAKTIGEYSDIVGGTDIVVSRPEQIANDLITLLKAITEGTSYRNTPAYVGKVGRDALKRTVFPQIYVFIGNSVIKPHDQVPTAFAEEIMVNIVGYVRNQTDGQHAGNLTDLLEGLIQDCLKALLPAITSNINTKKWMIDIHNGGVQVERTVDVEQSLGEFVLTFKVISYAMDYEREIVV